MESNRHDAHRDYPRGIVRYSLSLSLLAHYSSEKIEEDVEGEGEGDTVTTPGDTSGRPYKTSGSPPYRHQFVPRASRGNLGKEQRPTREEEMIEFVGKFPWTSRTFSYSCLLLLFFFLTSRTTAEYDSRDLTSMSNERTQDNDFRSCTGGKCIKRTTQEMSSGMWFGPRLGKRRKFEGRTDMDTDLETVGNAFDGSGWTIVALPGEKGRTSNRVKLDQKGDYDADELPPKFLLSKDSENARDEDGTFSSEPFSLAIARGNRRIPMTISSRFAHRSRVPTF
uniref:PBAN-type neuropeptides-like n=1 Tax=Vespula vulgaris TaxID=7454 RepID=UPI00223A6D31|nr:PBAN-type neuropeptides-like [Vespula vulgaris]